MLTAMVLGWPISSTYGARNFHRFGLRKVLIAGGALIALGGVPFVLLTPAVSPYVAGLGSLVMGFGLGFFNTAAIVIVQDSVDWPERGAATASFVFARNLGSTLGAAALGGLLNWRLASDLPARSTTSSARLPAASRRRWKRAGTRWVRACNGPSGASSPFRSRPSRWRYAFRRSKSAGAKAPSGRGRRSLRR
jgi:hypothetical protein